MGFKVLMCHNAFMAHTKDGIEDSITLKVRGCGNDSKQSQKHLWCHLASKGVY